jgi:hypothetical protein
MRLLHSCINMLIFCNISLEINDVAATISTNFRLFRRRMLPEDRRRAAIREQGQGRDETQMSDLRPGETILEVSVARFAR